MTKQCKMPNQLKEKCQNSKKHTNVPQSAIMCHKVLISANKLQEESKIVTFLTFLTKQRKVLQRFYPNLRKNLQKNCSFVCTPFHLCWRILRGTPSLGTHLSLGHTPHGRLTGNRPTMVKHQHLKNTLQLFGSHKALLFSFLRQS